MNRATVFSSSAVCGFSPLQMSARFRRCCAFRRSRRSRRSSVNARAMIRRNNFTFSVPPSVPVSGCLTTAAGNTGKRPYQPTRSRSGYVALDDSTRDKSSCDDVQAAVLEARLQRSAEIEDGVHVNARCRTTSVTHRLASPARCRSDLARIRNRHRWHRPNDQQRATEPSFFPHWRTSGCGGPPVVDGPYASRSTLSICQIQACPMNGTAPPTGWTRGR